MTPGTDPNQVIAGVLDALQQARSLLLDPSPRNIDCCRSAISRCAQTVVNVMDGDRSVWNKDELRYSLLAMRSELSAIAKLLDSAAAFRRDTLKAVSGSPRPRVIEIDTAAVQTVGRVHVLG